jgi:urocanate hydratase
MSCNGWPQEAALRLLMNNLDSHVAECPGDRAVYGASRRAARRSAACDAIVAALPTAIFHTHGWTPRVRIAKPQSVPACDPGPGIVRQA